MPIKLQKGLFIGDYPLSQRFGENPDWYKPFNMLGHNGIDYAVPTGTPLTSCLNGTVIECAYDAGGYGNYLKIENNSCGVIYAHMKKLSDYKPGMEVCAGATIGLSGNTGNSTGSHLHFGVFPKPRDRGNGYAGYIDPLKEENVLWVDNINEIPESAVVAELNKTIEGLRKSRDNWKKEHGELEKKLEKEKLVSEKLINQQIVLRAELERFNKEVIYFKLLHKRIQVLITPEDGVQKGGVI